MTQRDKVIAIVRDVIDRIEQGRLTVRSGYYLWLMDRPTFKGLETVDKIEQNCQVCAQGAMFLSHLRLYDNFELSQLVKCDQDNVMARGIIARELADTFGQEQLDIIEVAFEGTSFEYSNVSSYLAEKSINFGQQFLSSENRLLAICYNILENEGEFIP